MRLYAMTDYGTAAQAIGSFFFLRGDRSTQANELAGKQRMHSITLPFP